MFNLICRVVDRTIVREFIQIYSPATARPEASTVSGMFFPGRYLRHVDSFAPRARFNGYLYLPGASRGAKFSNLNGPPASELSLVRRLFADPPRHSRRLGVVRASTRAQTTHPHLRGQNAGINHQACAAGRADRHSSHRTGLPSRVRCARFVAGKYFPDVAQNISFFWGRVDTLRIYLSLWIHRAPDNSQRGRGV